MRRRYSAHPVHFLRYPCIAVFADICDQILKFDEIDNGVIGELSNFAVIPDFFYFSSFISASSAFPTPEQYKGIDFPTIEINRTELWEPLLINIYCIQTIQLDQVDRFIGLFCKFFNVRADQIDDIILGQNLDG